MNISELYQNIKQLFQPYIERQWDGSASNYANTDDYCSACLIDVNPEGEEKTQALCKLPVRDPGSNSINPEGLKAAVGGRGITQVTKPASVSDEEWNNAVKQAADTIISNYPELLDTNAPDSVYEIAGKEPPGNEERAMSYDRVHNALVEKMYELDRMTPGTDHYFVDCYFDETGYYALYTDRGKLVRYPLQVEGDDLAFGDMQPVMEVHQPVETRTVIRQQSDGRYRWFSVSGTAVLNRSGEIDSRDLFDSFVAYAERTGEYPIRQFYHQGESYRTGQADFLARDGYCYITSGLYDDTPLAQAEIQARLNNPDYWGDSIGFVPTVDPELSEISNGINIPVYRQGINKEISTLPEKDAAHLFTRTEVQMSLEGKAWEAFVALWGDEEKARQWLEQNPQARNRAIEEAGLIRREGESDDSQQNEGGQEFEIDQSVIDEVSRSVLESETITNLSTQLKEAQEAIVSRDKDINDLTKAVNDMAKRLNKLEGVQTEAQRQINLDTPAKFKAGNTRLIYRPREAHSNGEQVSFAERAMANAPKEIY